MNSETVRHIRPEIDVETLRENRFEQTLNALVENFDLDAININELDLIIQNSFEAGEHFTNFLRTVGKTIVARKMSRIIKINRNNVFNPAQFMEHQGLEIEEQDDLSIMLEEIDSSIIALESMLQDEVVIKGEEHLKRLKQAGHIRLDARIFQTLWENQHLIPEYWKGTTDNPKHIFFDGTILINHCGRYVISMYWDMKKWNWTYCRLDIGGWKAEDLSAVIKRAEPLRRIERRRRRPAP